MGEQEEKGCSWVETTKSWAPTVAGNNTRIRLRTDDDEVVKKQSLPKKRTILTKWKYVHFERLTWLTKMSLLTRLTLIGVTLTLLTWLNLLTRLTLTGVAGTAAVGAVIAPAVATKVEL